MVLLMPLLLTDNDWYVEVMEGIGQGNTLWPLMFTYSASVLPRCGSSRILDPVFGQSHEIVGNLYLILDYMHQDTA